MAIAGASEVRRLATTEIRAIDLAVPLRGREWVLAGVGIAAGTAVLVGYSALPWVRASEGDLTPAVQVLVVATIALLSIALTRTRLARWLRRWQPLYIAVSNRGHR